MRVHHTNYATQEKTSLSVPGVILRWLRSNEFLRAIDQMLRLVGWPRAVFLLFRYVFWERGGY